MKNAHMIDDLTCELQQVVDTGVRVGDNFAFGSKVIMNISNPVYCASVIPALSTCTALSYLAKCYIKSLREIKCYKITVRVQRTLRSTISPASSFRDAHIVNARS
jgi:hypothetical protein